MKNPVDDDDLPDEIDFSGGVRGKYVERYREGVSVRELPPIDPIHFYEVQSRLGHALWHAQALESTLVAYLALVFDMPPDAAGHEAVRLLEHSPAGLLERLRGDVEGQQEVVPGLEQRLTGFFAERDWLVHRSRHRLEDELSAPDHGRSLTRRLESIVDEAQYLNQKLAALLEQRLRHRGWSKAEVRSRARGIIDQWAAA